MTAAATHENRRPRPRHSRQAGSPTDFKQDYQDTHDIQDIQRPTKKNTRVVLQNLQAVFRQELDAKQVSTLPLQFYLIACCEYLEAHPNPDIHPDWHSPMFAFARLAKAHPSICHCNAREACDTVETCLERWSSEDGSAWVAHFEDVYDDEEAREDFMYSWDSIKYLPGYDPLQNAMQHALAKPLEPPIARSDAYARFISLAGWLQVFHPGPILLPVEKIASILAVSPRSVSH